MPDLPCHRVPAFAALLFLCTGAASACDSEDEIPFESCAVPTLPDAPLEVDAGTFHGESGEVIPNGANSYPLLQHIGYQDLDAVRDIFNQVASLGRPYVRTPGFMDGGDNPARIRDDDGTIREEGLEALDRVVAEASDAGVAVLLVLTNNWDDFGGAPAVVEMIAPGEGLPKDAFWSEPRIVAAQIEYVQTIASRTNSITGHVYGEDPSVLGFELCNEARCDDADWCEPSTLPNWANAMSGAIREAGGMQPIFWGGHGYRGEYGEDLEDIAMYGGVDVLTMHLYLAYGYEYLYALPQESRIYAAISAGAKIINDRADLAAEYGLPIVLEEFGWRPFGAPNPDAERAKIFKGWLAVAHHRSIATMPWMIAEQDRPDYDGYLIRPTDVETWGVLSCE